MSGIRIIATGKSVGSRKILNKDWEVNLDTSDEWIVSRTGIKQRYFCDDNENATTLAIAAANNVVEKACENFKKIAGENVCEKESILNEIGCVIVATSSAENAFPSTACMVAKELSLPNDVMSFDLSAACSGFVYATEVALGLLLRNKKKYALVIGTEQMSKLIDKNDRSTCVLFGDAAGAVLIEASDNKYSFRGCSMGDDELLVCKNRGGSYLTMDGKNVFRFATRVIKETIDDLLKENNMTISQVDKVVCHQANQRIIDHVAKKYDCDENIFFKNVDKYANTSAASIPLALDELFRSGELKSKMTIIIVGFGAGLTWGGALIEL